LDTYNKLQSSNMFSNIQIAQINKDYTAMLGNNAVDKTTKNSYNKH